jgi:hypothetical protein
MRLFPLLCLLACDSTVQTGALRPGEGQPCDSTCADELVCSQAGVCAQPGEPGTARLGDDCSATADCEWALECSSANVCAEADAPGTGGARDTCTDDDDCQAGYACEEGKCADIGVPYWTGGGCPADADDDAEFRVLFQIPDLPTTDELDFFSMPFPNDLRLDADSHPVLDGFPVPGESAPAVERLLGFVEGQTGWGLDPVVFFRFNKPQDLDSLRALTTDATIHFASIDPDASDYGELPSFQFFTRQSRDRYICQNWLAVTTYGGRPLLPNQQYAVWLTKGITHDGEEIFRDRDFPVLMQNDRPTDLTDARAYDKFAAFRDYVDNAGLTRGEIVAATMFTTGDPARDLRYTREVVDDEATDVSVGAFAACDASPCGRACAGVRGLSEWHAKVNVPRFTTDGGVVSWNDTFRPIVQSTETLCAVVTVPDGTAPAAGWPVALWFGDLGSTAQGALENGVAAAFAAEGVATLAVDLPEHGDRGDGGDALAAWFDTDHPAAWRGSLYQAYADGHALVRLAGDPQLGLDPDDLWIVGEGVGADAGAPLLAWVKTARGGVLGNPAGLSGQLAASRSAPFDLEHALQRSYADSNLARHHPLVSFLQQWLGPLDPMGSATAMVRDPATIAKHVLLVDGVEDTEIPSDNRHAFLRAASLPTAGGTLDVFDEAQGELDYPVSENVSTGDGKRTAAVVQYPAGHHALSESAAEQAAAFIASGAGGAAPTLRE